MNRFSLLRAIFLLAIALVTGCAPAPSISDVDLLSTVVAQTLTAVPPTASQALPTTATSTPESAATVPPPTDTPAPAGPLYVFTQDDNVNLRVQPGTLFKVSRVMPKGSRLQVLGVSPGGDWLNVLNDEAINGWVGTYLVGGGFDTAALPVVTPVEVLTISGRVTDGNGTPISGIGFAVTQKTGSSTSRVDGMTDASGTFYVFLPLSMSGNWTVEFVSVACTSNTMDANCQCLNGVCGRPDPQSVTISLPLPGPLNFTWK